MSINNNELDEATLSRLADKLCSAARALMREAKTEEDLKIGFEKRLGEVLSTIGIQTEPTYETFGAKTASVFKGRPDAVHGLVIIEYKAPGAFDSEREIKTAYGELVGYMTALGVDKKRAITELMARLVGVGFDGDSLFFVRYTGDGIEPGAKVDDRAFARQGPYVLDNESARTLLTHLRGLARIPLSPESLARKFGPRSKLAPLVVGALVDSFGNWASPRVAVFFNEWKRLFGIVYGEEFGAKQGPAVKELAAFYGIPETADLQLLLFTVHTYYALLIKLIAAEILTLNENPYASSFNHRLTHAAKDEFLEALADVEDGGVYFKRGINNFLEGDFFRWYLDAWSARLEDALREVTRALSEFEPATSHIAPAAGRDLLKKLYQYLVPPGLRRVLGEFYTPDWLAELVIKEVGYNGDTRKRFLDPACGSGTFLVLAIEKARAFAEKKHQPAVETAKNIVANIWGFDLNPLAVIAARTNYLFALGPLAAKLHNFEIPVYLADSVLWPERGFDGQLNFSGIEVIKVGTSVGEFHVPHFWIEGRGFLLGMVAPTLEQVVKSRYTVAEAVEQFKHGGLVLRHREAVETFYRELLTLEEKGLNGIWVRFLKNAFAPVVADKFDFVVGNPPWVRWGYLSAAYRAATLPMWQRYGLFSLRGHAARLGGGEKDFSMLFTYACADYYLRDGGKLGFLITQEVVKGKGAGEGFRRFRLNGDMPIKVLKAHDLVAVKPFEGAANKTAALVIKKGEETTYPVPYVEWARKKGVGFIPTDLRWAEARRFLQSRDLEATPISLPAGAWQTIATGDEGRLLRIQGTNPYKTRLGARVEPYGVFWLEIKEVLGNKDLLVRNMAEKGKRSIKTEEHRIESALVFPAVRGADIKRWGAIPGTFVLMVQDPKVAEPFPVSKLKTTWPRTYTYLTKFKEILLSRGSKTVREFAEKTAFYAMYGIGPYTVARYKVVWKRMASELVAAVISQCKTPFGYKAIIPTDTTSLIAFNNEAEAHYVCAVLNSMPVRRFVKTYSAAGRGFGAPSALNPVGIPKFDAKNKNHTALAGISARLHVLAAKGEAQEAAKLEADVDRLAKKLFGIK